MQGEWLLRHIQGVSASTRSPRHSRQVRAAVAAALCATAALGLTACGAAASRSGGEPAASSQGATGGSADTDAGAPETAVKPAEPPAGGGGDDAVDDAGGSPDMSTPGAQALPPTTVDVASLGGDTALAVSVAAGSPVVLVVPDGEEGDWTATVSDPDAARFVAGGDMGGWTARPAIEVLAPGQVDVTVTGPEGAAGTFTIVASDPVEPPVIGDPAGEPTIDPAIEQVAEAAVGMSEQEAIAAITAAGGGYRIIGRDGEDFPMTMDYRLDRVNLRIEDGIVTEASIG